MEPSPETIYAKSWLLEMLSLSSPPFCLSGYSLGLYLSFLDTESHSVIWAGPELLVASQVACATTAGPLTRSSLNTSTVGSCEEHRPPANGSFTVIIRTAALCLGM